MINENLYLIFFTMRGCSEGIDYVVADSYEEAHQITMDHYSTRSIYDINGIVKFSSIGRNLTDRILDHINDRQDPKSKCYQKPLPEEQ